MREHKLLLHVGRDDWAELLADIRKSVYPMIFEKSYYIGRVNGGLRADPRGGRAERMRAAGGKDRPVRHKVLGELVRDIAVLEKRSGLKTSSRRSRLVTTLG